MKTILLTGFEPFGGDRVNPSQQAAAALSGLEFGGARVAVNVLDFSRPDNAGQTLRDQPVIPGGPDALLSTLPLRSIVAAGLPGYISDTAGLYLCNQVMYCARHLLGPTVPAGFLHLPASHELALERAQPLPYLPQSELTRAVQVALEALIDTL